MDPLREQYNPELGSTIEQPFTSKHIIRRDYRKELNRIILEPEADDVERLFLVSFLRDKADWLEPEIANFIHNWTRWSDYDRAVTSKQINSIFEGKESDRLQDFGSQSLGSQVENKVETQERKSLAKMKQSPVGDYEKSNVAPSEFQVSGLQNLRKVRGGEKLETVKSLTKTDNGNRWYELSQKKGKFGTFFSLDSGRLVETMEGETARGKPDRYFTVPTDTKIIDLIIDGLEQIKKIPIEPMEKKK